MPRAARVRATLVASIAFALLTGVTLPAVAHVRTEGKPPNRVEFIDASTEHDATDMSIFVTNVGSVGFDASNGASGLEWPKGSFKTAMFASGLWVGATVAGQPRVTVAEYSFEYGPGRIVGGAPELDSPDLRCFKVQTIHAPAAGLDTTNWQDYRLHAAPHGAPLGVRRMPDTSTPNANDSVDVSGPDLPGEAAVWSVYNDADPNRHTNDAGNTAPLGIEVRQTAFSKINGPAVYVSWQIRNGGPSVLQNAYVSLWSDPDLGGAADDLVGYDANLQMGYCYNADNQDNLYGTTPPALGLLLVQGPYDPTAGVRRPAYAFSKYINGTDPSSPTQSYNYMQGLNADGTPIIDPTTALPTRFALTGDPVFGNGWIDSNPADRRMMITAGPFTLAPGQSTDLVVAYIVEQGADRLASIAKLRCKAQYVKDQYLQGFPAEVEPECDGSTAARCPAPAAYFAGICDNPSAYPPGTVFALANCADLRSTSLAITDPIGWCNLLHATITASQRAYREYLTLMANSCAFHGNYPLTAAGGKLVGISDATPASVPPLLGSTVGELLLAATNVPPPVFEADYVNAVNPADPNGLLPVDFGLPGFGGGAGAMSESFASSLDPFAQIDSFPRVELTFDATKGQLAHRYLRLQTVEGGTPINGREYRYGGRHFIPVVAHDPITGEQLELAFVERTVADFDGTILSPAEQLATFDSTWAPSDEFDGGREYLAVFRRGYTGAPRPEFAVDGAFIDGSLPGLYTLFARTEPGRTVDDGDGFYWQFGPAPGSMTSIDQYLIALAQQPQNDPKVIAAYDALAANLALINSGITIGGNCDPSVPIVLALVEATADEGGVTIVWHAEGDVATFGLERRRGDDSWRSLGLVSPDGTGRVVYRDVAVAPGERWSYRLVDPNSGAPWAGSEATVLVPGGVTAGALELAGVVPDGNGDGVLVRFTLPAAGEARLAMYDALGRRVATIPLGRLEAGTFVKRIGDGTAHRSGLYFVRLEFAGQHRVAKALVLNR